MFLWWALVLASGNDGNSEVFLDFSELQFCSTEFGGFDCNKSHACGKANRPQRSFFKAGAPLNSNTNSDRVGTEEEERREAREIHD